VAAGFSYYDMVLKLLLFNFGPQSLKHLYGFLGPATGAEAGSNNDFIRITGLDNRIPEILQIRNVADSFQPFSSFTLFSE
jgi:hypothetical protein